MSVEIERKYLLREAGINCATDLLDRLSSSLEALERHVLNTGELIRQGYLQVQLGLAIAKGLGARVDFNPEEARLRDRAGVTMLTLKGPGDLVRDEFEIEIPRKVFARYWPLTEHRRIEKVRRVTAFSGKACEIDVYTDRDLIVVEVEFDSMDEALEFPAVGKDITGDPNYKNRNLAK